VSAVLGIDLSSHFVDLVLLDEDSTAAEWTRLTLEGGSSFDRCRYVARVMPSRSWLEDAGVYLAAIVKPMCASFVSAAAQFPVFGAVAVSLPASLVVWSFTPAEWKRELRVHLARKPTADEIAAVVGDVAHTWPQDALDACGVAYAARELNARAAAKGLAA
jgi:hypothetical protein